MSLNARNFSLWSKDFFPGLSKIDLNAENYFSWTGHFSNSFFKAMKKCESSALAQYVDGQNQGFKQCFAEGHILENGICLGLDRKLEDLEFYGDNLYKKKTKKQEEAGLPADTYAWVNNLDTAIVRVREDEFIMDNYINNEGNEFQAILEFELAGQPWKCAIDILNKSEQTFTDIKSTGFAFASGDWGFCDVALKRRKMKFIDLYDYWQQMALYQEAIRQNFTGRYRPAIVAVHKPKTQGLPADVRAFDMHSPKRYERTIEAIISAIPGMQKTIEMRTPYSCGTCHNCISTRINYQCFDANEFCEEACD